MYIKAQKVSSVLI